MDGASLARAEADKERMYPELAGPNPYGELLVLAAETGGHWNKTALDTVSRLIDARTKKVSPMLRRAAKLAYHRRWWGILSAALQQAVALCCLDHPGMGSVAGLGPEPCLAEVITEAHETPEVSLLGLRA